MNFLPHSCSRRLILLAPRGANASAFVDVTSQEGSYDRVLAATQRFRGEVYSTEGNLAVSDLSPDGRHMQAADYKGWHLVTLGSGGAIEACARVMVYRPDVNFGQLMVSRSALAHSAEWSEPLRLAVDGVLRCARSRRMWFAEVGGWAIARALRCTTEAVRMIVAVYALGELLGGVAAISTADARNHSASTLRRTGWSPLAIAGHELPSYYEPLYRSQLQILAFDSSQPAARYQAHVDRCRAALRCVTVLAPAQIPEREYSASTVVHPDIVQAGAIGSFVPRTSQ